MALLNSASREKVNARGEELLEAGLTWRERVAGTVLERLQLEAPSLYRRAASGRFEHVESPLREQRLSAARESQSRSADPWAGLFAGAEWLERVSPPMAAPADRGGVGGRAGPPIELTGDGVKYFRGRELSGWSPSEKTTERFWLLDDAESGLRDFAALVSLHESLCRESKKQASGRWLWNQLLAWITERVAGARIECLFDYIQARFALEPTEWQVALRLEGVRFRDFIPDWQDEPIDYSWMGQQLVDGRFMVARVLDEFAPNRDPELAERNEDWWRSNDWADKIAQADWILFSPKAGDRFGVLQSRLIDASEPCALLAVFDSTTGARSASPTIARSSEDVCAILFAVSGNRPDHERPIPIGLSEIPRDFLSPQELTPELVLLPEPDSDAREARLEALSRASEDFQLLKSESGPRRLLVGAIRRSIRRLARARGELDGKERLFLLVTALDALLVGSSVKQSEHGKTFVARFLSLAIPDQHWGRREAARAVVDRAWGLRNSFAHGDAEKSNLSERELESFEAMVVSVTRRLFLSAASWASLEEFRAELSEISAETLRRLKTLDELRNISPPDDGSEAN